MRYNSFIKLGSEYWWRVWDEWSSFNIRLWNTWRWDSKFPIWSVPRISRPLGFLSPNGTQSHISLWLDTLVNGYYSTSLKGYEPPTLPTRKLPFKGTSHHCQAKVFILQYTFGFSNLKATILNRENQSFPLTLKINSARYP